MVGNYTIFIFEMGRTFLRKAFGDVEETIEKGRELHYMQFRGGPDRDRSISNLRISM